MEVGSSQARYVSGAHTGGPKGENLSESCTGWTTFGSSRQAGVQSGIPLLAIQHRRWAGGRHLGAQPAPL